MQAPTTTTTTPPHTQDFIVLPCLCSHDGEVPRVWRLLGAHETRTENKHGPFARAPADNAASARPLPRHPPLPVCIATDDVYGSQTSQGTPVPNASLRFNGSVRPFAATGPLTKIANGGPRDGSLTGWRYTAAGLR